MVTTGRCFLVALTLSNFFLASASPAEQHGDAVALVQQRTHSKPGSMSLARMLDESFRTQPNSYEEVIDTVVQKAGEAKLLNFWDKAMEIARAENMTQLRRGFLMLQETAKVISSGDGNDDDGDGAASGGGGLMDLITSTGIYKRLTKEWHSEPNSCLITRAGIVLDIGDLSVAIGFIVGKKCDVTGLCPAAALDIFRALVYLGREYISGSKSYCRKKISPEHLCTASVMGVAAEVTGVVHSSLSLKYKCDENSYNPSAESKIFGRGARGVLCGWDITRGIAYTIVGLYRFYSFAIMSMPYDETYVDPKTRRLWRPKGGEMEPGQSAWAYMWMGLGGFAWLANALTTILTNCPDGSKEVSMKNPACGKEIAELAAYVFQSLGWALNFEDYCFDHYKKNDLRRGSTVKGHTERDFRDKMINKMGTMEIYKPMTEQELRAALDEPMDKISDERISELANSPGAKKFGRDIAKEIMRLNPIKNGGDDDPMTNKQVLQEEVLSSNQVENVGDNSKPKVKVTVDTNKVTEPTMDSDLLPSNEVVPKTGIDDVLVSNEVSPLTVDSDLDNSKVLPKIGSNDVSVGNQVVNIDETPQKHVTGDELPNKENV